MNSRTRNIARFSAVAVVAVVVALLAVACGGDDSSADAADSRERGEKAALAWAKCMRENGANVADPTVDADGRLVITPETASGPPDESFRAAMAQCRDLLRDALPKPADELSKEEQARMRDAALEFTKCMREHGIDMPDPSTTGGGIAIPIKPNDPAFQRAAEACQDKLPLPGEES